MFVYLKFDPSEGFSLIDALDFDERHIGLNTNLVFTLKCMTGYCVKFEIKIT